MNHPTIKEISFPPEILQQFVAALGPDDRRLLIPLLLVSRQFRDLTLPILYESITIIPEPASIMDPDLEPTPRPLSFPSIYIHSDRLPLLNDTLTSENGQDLASFMKMLFMHPALWSQQREIAEQTMKMIRTLLPHLSNLQRLSIIHLALRLGEVIPKTTLLTHLDISSESENEVLEVLKRQPALRVLALNIMSIIPSPPIECTLSLPHLRTYHGPLDFWKGIYTTSPLVHSLYCDTTFGGILPVYPFYSNLKAIDISSSDLKMYVSVLPLLTQVEYIRIKRKDLAARPTELVGYLRQIPSQSLKYLAIHTMEEIDSGINQPILGSVFGELPSVRMIDVRGTRWTSLSMSFETIRYTRTDLPRTVNIPAWMLFGWWWLCVQDDLEAIDPA